MTLPFDLRGLEVFLMVAECGGFSAAGRRLHMAQSAVSQRIATLERRLGLTLLQRQERRVTLTPEGEVLCRQARELLTQARSTALAMRELHDLVRGELRLGLPSMLGSYYLPPLLMGFKARYPGIQMTVVEGGTRRLQQRIQAGELDLGVVMDDPGDPALTRRHLLREEMVVCVGRDHPFASRTAITPREFFAEPLVLFEAGYFHREFVTELARRHRCEPEVGFESNLIPLTKAIVRQGFGITTFLRRVVDDPNLAAVSFAPPAWLDLALAWKAGARLSRAEQAFVDYALAHRQQL
ncbi:LysR family transcriptional regulator [Halomonas sp. 328]|uniref:LysR family transcriptional regulator n=1 Tax=Halomonas sp. 328 TaxID=2776704 RepID=UPI0018A7C641|nr:LysR family transcriptional regulator [Halomonas sp. 328]MBF8222486.1 LysR family transcriptional regulator [Halomonas sp. 328]